MIILTGKKEQKAFEYINKAAEVAKQSNCFRSKCGSIVVKNNKIIGVGFNNPPQNSCLQECRKDFLPKDFKSDKTCCVHAEQRAIIDALKKHPTKIKNSTLYFIRLGEKNKPVEAGNPYCTICSKMALDTGIKYFVLWHKKGVAVYNTKEYNELSFQYVGD